MHDYAKYDENADIGGGGAVVMEDPPMKVHDFSGPSSSVFYFILHEATLQFWENQL